MNRLYKRNYSNIAFKYGKKMMPTISQTEMASLRCGTVGFDGNIFSGNPCLSDLQKYNAKLEKNERKFIELHVKKLCDNINDYQITQDQDLTKDNWDYIKKNKFLSFIIPEKYGGLEFTPHGTSQIVQMISSRSGSVGTTVMVPNSLGPGELLMKYGTEKQKNNYLPKLANGEHIPCFGLTGIVSGSDAASMTDEGIVVEKNGKKGIILNCNKRYITLAPVASLIGIAFKLRDPNNLLESGKEGITLALLSRDTPNLKVGRRHDPLSSAFMNGTIQGEDVFITFDEIIGGEEQCGNGWSMLMECLSAGRGISLPSIAVATSKLASTAVGSYARARKQFKVPIADMEGIQEKLCEVAGNTFTITSAQHLMNAMLNNGEEPSVLSAVMKQQTTERARNVINHSMDILGGSAIINGPNNYIANVYQQIPIGITVEGSNTLTRSLIIFGQGLMRSHPHLLNTVLSLEKNDKDSFRKELNGFISHSINNFMASTWMSTFRKRNKSNPISYYESQLLRYSKSFAFSSNLGLLLGKKLKFSEMTSGRYADIFSNIYLGYANLWYFQKLNNKEIEPVLIYEMDKILYDIQESFYALSENFPIKSVGKLIKFASFPYGKIYKKPNDELKKNVSDLISKPSSLRDILSENIFISNNPYDRVNMLHNSLEKIVEADDIIKNKGNYEFTENELKIINEADNYRNKIIQVDTFETLKNNNHLEKHF